MAGLKEILVSHKDQFARTLTERIMTYACGRRIEAFDRRDRDRIAKQLAARGYGFRDLIELTVSGDAFRVRQGDQRKGREVEGSGEPALRPAPQRSTASANASGSRGFER